MGLYLNPDNRMFQRSLDDLFYVDKTGLAAFLNQRMGTARGLACVSRPRRFGKSVDADMLCAYYSRGCDSRAQFEGLAVSSDPTYKAHLNAHDVIRLDVQRMSAVGGGVNGLIRSIEREVLAELRERWPMPQKE